jgi:Archaeal fructose-1,6-bisphosphatase and related enzymes of inositol monophosphatase family
MILLFGYSFWPVIWQTYYKDKGAHVGDRLANDLDLAMKLADVADKVTSARFCVDDLVVETKPDMTLVSDADRATEDALLAVLEVERPSDSVLGEERGERGCASRKWILDPIDGTHNYVRGVPVFATLIGLEEDGEIVVGVVSAPALGRRWWARKGAGAFGGSSLVGGRQLQVSKVADLANASLSYSSLGGWGASKGAFLSLMDDCWRTRAYGDFWSYMMVAEGAVDLAAEPELELYDMAALVPIVTEAGGSFTSLDGKPGPWGKNAVATNGLLHEGVLERLGR